MFDATIRYFAFGPALLAAATSMRAKYGAHGNTAPGHKKGINIQTLLCGPDNADTGKLRAMTLGVDAIPITLTDGRHVLGGYWTVAAVEAFGAGELDGEEITELEVRTLMPTVEI